MATQPVPRLRAIFRKFSVTFLIAITAVCCLEWTEDLSGIAYARKINVKVKADKNRNKNKKGKTSEESEILYFAEADSCGFQNYGLFPADKLILSGFDKKNSSSKESFFITNRSGYSVERIFLTFTYLTSDGRMLHKRAIELDMEIPPGETRKTDIPSFDTQKSFHYIHSPAPTRKPSTPFSVTIVPDSIRISKKIRQNIPDDDR